MNAPPRPLPLREVVSARYRVTTKKQITSQWWVLRLDCGHTEKRRVRFPPHGKKGGTVHRNPEHRSKAMASPKRCRCSKCGGQGRD